jgi:hypothetical protein
MNTTETNQRHFRLAPFAIAIICFIMPFLKISCAGEGKDITGVQLVTGFQIKEPTFNYDTGQSGTRSKRFNAEPLIVLVLLCAVAGAGLCFRKDISGKLFPAIAGGIGFALMLVAKIHFDNEAMKQGGGALAIEYLIGFVLVCLFLLGGCVISGYQYQQAKKDAGCLPVPPPPPPPTNDAIRSPVNTVLPPPPSPPPLAEAPLPSAASKLSNQYYFADAQSQPKGPFSFDELLVLEKSGTIKADTNVIIEGASEWNTWSSIKTKERKN